MQRSNPRTYLYRFLEANWLKPFDAVWDAAVASILSEASMPEPSLDVGCGDGLFMLIASGGRLRLAYDRYTDTSDTRMPLSSMVTEPSLTPFTIGLDVKAGLVDKARRTGAYRQMVVGDGQALPFHDQTFASIFSNTLYWLPDWRRGLQEMRRVVRDDGRVVLVVPNRGIGEHLRSYHRARRYQQGGRHLAAAFFDSVDRGRFQTLTRLTGDLDAWRRRMTDVGFRVCTSVSVLHPGVVTRWDFGTRPCLRLLILMSRWLQAVRLKSVVKRLVVSALERPLWPWVEQSTAPPGTSTYSLWVLVMEPVRQLGEEEKDRRELEVVNGRTGAR